MIRAVESNVERPGVASTRAYAMPVSLLAAGAVHLLLYFGVQLRSQNAVTATEAPQSEQAMVVELLVEPSLSIAEPPETPAPADRGPSEQAEPKQAEPKQAEPKQAEPNDAEPKQALPVRADEPVSAHIPPAAGVAEATRWPEVDPQRLLGLRGWDAAPDASRGPRRDRGRKGDRSLRDLQQRLDQQLGQATEVPHASERPAPALELRSDGTLHYKSASIKARILSDGSVELIEPDAVWVRLNVESIWERLTDREKRRAWVERVYSGQVIDCVTSTSSGCTSALPLLEGGFDTCALESRDCYAYEKQWFMKQTQSLREKLHQRWRNENMRRSLHTLELQVASILMEEGLDLLEKQTALEALLADCSDDWEGAQARALLTEAIEDLKRESHASRQSRANHEGQDASAHPDAGS